MSCWKVKKSPATERIAGSTRRPHHTRSTSIHTEVQRSFAVCGPTLWNSLPLNVRDSSLNLPQFCTRLKTVLFSRAYTQHHHSASVTVLGCKDCCAKHKCTYLLTYLLKVLTEQDVTVISAINFYTRLNKHQFSSSKFHGDQDHDRF